MSPFDFHILAWPATAIFGSTLFISFWATKQVQPSIFFAFFKSGLFLLYFGVFFDGTFTFLDDWSYLEGGLLIAEENIGFSSLMHNLDFLFFIAGGDHFIYYLHNAYAIRIFGIGYYAPVALNIILTLFIAFLGMILSAQEFGFSKKSSRLLFFFLLAHPSVLAWSTVANLKDILVLLLHLIALLAASLFFRKRYFWAIILAIPCVAAFLFLRFYVPALFAFAIIMTLILTRRQIAKNALIALVLVFGSVFYLVGTGQISHSIYVLKSEFGNPVYGIIRFFFTPIPFNTESSYAFLDFPALIHWALFPFAVVGAAIIYRMKTPFSKFFLIYIVVFVVLFAVVVELQGPRHRVQLDFAIALLQFIGLSLFFKQMVVFGSHGIAKRSKVVPSKVFCTG